MTLSSLPVSRRSRRALTFFSVLTLVTITVWAGFSELAQAQSPTPNHYMEDSYPGNPFPSGADAVVVEGLGSLDCSFSESSIKSWTVEWTVRQRRVVTEITPQSACGTISEYKILLTRIKDYVEANAHYPAGRWAGFMLDEEPGYGFSPSQLESLNASVEEMMVNTPGMYWYFQDDQPNGWGLSTYNAILGYSWQAGQAYTSSMVSAMNAECSTYSSCHNVVTVNSYNSSPWNSLSYVSGLVRDGSPWQNDYWNTGWYWGNIWRYG